MLPMHLAHCHPGAQLHTTGFFSPPSFAATSLAARLLTECVCVLLLKQVCRHAIRRLGRRTGPQVSAHRHHHPLPPSHRAPDRDASKTITPDAVTSPLKCLPRTTDTTRTVTPSSPVRWPRHHRHGTTIGCHLVVIGAADHPHAESKQSRRSPSPPPQHDDRLPKRIEFLLFRIETRIVCEKCSRALRSYLIS